MFIRVVNPDLEGTCGRVHNDFLLPTLKKLWVHHPALAKVLIVRAITTTNEGKCICGHTQLFHYPQNREI